MSAWRTAKAIQTLQAEVNAAHPNRPKGADGTIGDARHQAEKSDHNPNEHGVVTAWDITTADFTDLLAEDLRLLGKAGDGRVKYVIFKGRIAGPPVKGWEWRPYSGFSKHFDHIHLSVSADPKQYDRTDPWQPKKAAVKRTPKPSAPTTEDDVTPQDKQEIVDMIIAKLFHGGPGGTALVATHEDIRTALYGTADGKHEANLDNIYAAVKKP